MAEVVLITKTVCSNCKAAIKRLDASGIEYAAKNFETDEDAARIAGEFGLLSAPALIVDGVAYRTMQEILSWIKSVRKV